VLALYPGTTTFYKAEVVAGWTLKGRKPEEAEGKKREKEGSVKLEEVPGEPPGPELFVRLRFEGEDEADREMSVERRYVLPDR
jgi:SAGA-associated factor 29